MFQGMGSYKPAGILTDALRSEWKQTCRRIAEKKVQDTEKATIDRVVNIWMELRSFLESGGRSAPPDLDQFLQHTNAPARALQALKWMKKNASQEMDLTNLQVPVTPRATGPRGQDGFDYTIPACFLWWVLLGEGSLQSPPGTCPSQATCLWLVFLRCWTILEGQESIAERHDCGPLGQPRKGHYILLAPMAQLLESRGAASASFLAFSAEFTNCCDSLKRFLTSRNFCDEAQMGCLSWRNRRSASASPCALGLSNTSCEIASHESWSVRAESSSPHHRLDLDGGCVLP